MVRRHGLLVDFGGVLTSSVFASFAAFCAAEGLPEDTVRRAFAEDDTARALLFTFELGRLDQAAFEARLAPLLGVGTPAGLVDRLFSGLRPDAAMLAAVTAARRGGARTGLISNSWGTGTGYDRAHFAELFDGVVISAEEGVRKPDPAVYALGAERIGLDAGACVFVDDLRGNLKPARALGMATVHHTSAETTIPQLEELLELPLR